ncbi:hypothetical protein HN51_044855 [Arachis hypogaea]
MRLMIVAWFIVFIISFEHEINVQGGRTQLSIINVSQGQSIGYVTVTGCNNDCDTACCNCDITKYAPVCVLCCEENP